MGNQLAFERSDGTRWDAYTVWNLVNSEDLGAEPNLPVRVLDFCHHALFCERRQRI